MTPEQRARAKIDRLLEAAGWHVCGVSTPISTPRAGVAIREFPLNPGTASPTTCCTSTARPPASSKPRRRAYRSPASSSSPAATRRACRRTLPAWRRPLPFAYESTGIETHFTNGLDPEPRSRTVFAFHRPETLRRCWLSVGLAASRRGCGAGHRRFTTPTANRPSTFLSPPAHMPPLVTEWGEHKLWPAQITAIRNLEASLAQTSRAR